MTNLEIAQNNADIAQGNQRRAQANQRHAQWNMRISVGMFAFAIVNFSMSAWLWWSN